MTISYINNIDQQPFVYFSQAQNNYNYGTGNYNEQNYNTGQGSAAEPIIASEPLIDTGTAILLSITIAAVIVFVSILVKVFRKNSKIKLSKRKKK